MGTIAAAQPVAVAALKAVQAENFLMKSCLGGSVSPEEAFRVAIAKKQARLMSRVAYSMIRVVDVDAVDEP